MFQQPNTMNALTTVMAASYVLTPSTHHSGHELTGGAVAVAALTAHAVPSCQNKRRYKMKERLLALTTKWRSCSPYQASPTLPPNTHLPSASIIL